MKKTGFGLSGLLIATIRVKPEEFDLIRIGGVDVREWKASEGRAVLTRPNAFVNQGLNAALDRIFNLSPPTQPTRIQLSSDNTAVTAATTTMGGTVSNKAFSPAATRSNQTVTAGADFTQADVSFSIRKVGLLNTATDAGTGLYDVIGGAGVSPYNQAFTIDLTSTTSFTLTMQIKVTASAT